MLCKPSLKRFLIIKKRKKPNLASTFSQQASDLGVYIHKGHWLASCCKRSKRKSKCKPSSLAFWSVCVLLSLVLIFKSKSWWVLIWFYFYVSLQSLYPKEVLGGCVRGTSSLGSSADFCEPDQVSLFQKPHVTAGVWLDHDQNKAPHCFFLGHN